MNHYLNRSLFVLTVSVLFVGCSTPRSVTAPTPQGVQGHREEFQVLIGEANILMRILAKLEVEVAQGERPAAKVYGNDQQLTELRQMNKMITEIKSQLIKKREQFENRYAVHPELCR